MEDFSFDLVPYPSVQEVARFDEHGALIWAAPEFFALFRLIAFASWL